jgi:hypothetical protein
MVNRTARLRTIEGGWRDAIVTPLTDFARAPQPPRGSNREGHLQEPRVSHTKVRLAADTSRRTWIHLSIN